MAKLINGPTIIRAEGIGDKLINEFFGLVNTGTGEVSIAHMISPAGWSEPGQRPEFNEYTVVLKGMLLVETINEKFTVLEGQAILAPKYEWVRYSTPAEEGAEYVSICVPAFSPATVNRDKVKEA
jgi:mannose-6-phosphate isomerase-like protein (cupin superfamily)